MKHLAYIELYIEDSGERFRFFDALISLRCYLPAKEVAKQLSEKMLDMAGLIHSHLRMKFLRDFSRERISYFLVKTLSETGELYSTLNGGYIEKEEKISFFPSVEIEEDYEFEGIDEAVIALQVVIAREMLEAMNKSFKEVFGREK